MRTVLPEVKLQALDPNLSLEEISCGKNPDSTIAKLDNAYRYPQHDPANRYRTYTIYRMASSAEFPTIPPDSLDALAHPHPAKPQTKNSRKASALCVLFALAVPAYVRY